MGWLKWLERRWSAGLARQLREFFSFSGIAIQIACKSPDRFSILLSPLTRLNFKGKLLRELCMRGTEGGLKKCNVCKLEILRQNCPAAFVSVKGFVVTAARFTIQINCMLTASFSNTGRRNYRMLTGHPRGRAAAWQFFPRLRDSNLCSYEWIPNHLILK